MSEDLVLLWTLAAIILFPVVFFALKEFED